MEQESKDPVPKHLALSVLLKDFLVVAPQYADSLMLQHQETEIEGMKGMPGFRRVNGRLEDLKKVLIVGEIYVRRDNFSVEELSETLIAKGIYPKVTGVTEWLNRFSGNALIGPQPGCPPPADEHTGWHRREVFRGPARQAPGV